MFTIWVHFDKLLADGMDDMAGFIMKPAAPAYIARIMKRNRLFVFLRDFYPAFLEQIIVELDDELAARLERVAPGRSRRRSDFIRMAIRRALWELEERETAEAYAREPDAPEDAYWDPGVWEPRARKRRSR